jgi:uncharacterized protein with ParB-like and HNH nuclease domain
MEARKTNIQDILEGTKQYLIPLFQRAYDWEKENWENLWIDLMELYHSDSPNPHFIGSIVSSSNSIVSIGVPKFLVIDGQQRLTTLSILLILLRDKAKENDLPLADEIQSSFLVNQFKKGDEHFRLMPTQQDRKIYQGMILNDVPHDEKTKSIFKAYDYFDRQFKSETPDLERLLLILKQYLSVVVIELGPDDNPYLVFESLNAKGKKLEESDLIRNYFFMQLD